MRRFAHYVSCAENSYLTNREHFRYLEFKRSAKRGCSLDDSQLGHWIEEMTSVSV